MLLGDSARGLQFDDEGILDIKVGKEFTEQRAVFIEDF